MSKMLNHASEARHNAFMSTISRRELLQGGDHWLPRPLLNEALAARAARIEAWAERREEEEARWRAIYQFDGAVTAFGRDRILEGPTPKSFSATVALGIGLDSTPCGGKPSLSSEAGGHTNAPSGYAPSGNTADRVRRQPPPPPPQPPPRAAEPDPPLVRAPLPSAPLPARRADAFSEEEPFQTACGEVRGSRWRTPTTRGGTPELWAHVVGGAGGVQGGASSRRPSSAYGYAADTPATALGDAPETWRDDSEPSEPDPVPELRACALCERRMPARSLSHRISHAAVRRHRVAWEAPFDEAEDARWANETARLVCPSCFDLVRRGRMPRPAEPELGQHVRGGWLRSLHRASSPRAGSAPLVGP